MMNIMMLGAPGAGKGTQAEMLSKQFSIPSISTGVMLRKAVADQTPAGLEMKKYMDEGLLVPDKVVLNILEERLQQPDCANGYILDGVPRNLAQAEALEKDGISFAHVLYLDTPDEVIVDRMVGRRTCVKCGAPFHMENFPPHVAGVCDLCGSELVRRGDDEPDKVLRRLQVYREETEPLVAYFAEKGLIRRIPVADTPGEVLAIIMQVLRP
jgi:adenylate kinases